MPLARCTHGHLPGSCYDAECSNRQPMPLRPRLVAGSRAGADIPTGEQDPEHTCTICGAPATGWIQYQDVRRPPWQVTHEWRCAEHMPPASA